MASRTTNNQETDRVAQPHDRAFRGAMADPRVARDFLSHYLPKDICKKIDLATLQPEPDSYVDSKLKLHLADLLCSAKRKDRPEENAYIYFLLEHFSTQRRLTPWRAAQYACQAMAAQLKKQKNKKYLPLVIPLVVYNGKNKYTSPTNVSELFRPEDRPLAEKYLCREFKLVDLTQVPDKEIRKHRYSQLMELLLKHARSRDAMACLEGLASEIAWLSRHGADDYIVIMLRYYLETAKTEDLERFTHFIAKNLQPLERQAMTLAQALKNEGRKEGVQQGVQQGMQQGMQQTLTVIDLLKNRIPVTEIAAVTGMTYAQIAEIKRHLFEQR